MRDNSSPGTTCTSCERPSLLDRKQTKRGSLDHVEAATRDRWVIDGTLIAETDRIRPRYFDGRFLSVDDILRDQAYFRTRQHDLATMVGSGVLAGFEVRQLGPSLLSVGAGVAVTPSGQLLVLAPTPNGDGTRALTLDLSNLPQSQQLSIELGLMDRPTRPLRAATGLYVLAARRVEYTANPQGAYPTSLADRRRPEDGDFIEAVALSLIPYEASVSRVSPSIQRGLVARSVFFDGEESGLPQNVVPLALLQLDAGKLLWADMFLARREVVAAQHWPTTAASQVVRVVGAGPSRSLQEAFAIQHQQHLQDVLRDRTRNHQSLRFSASEVFQALPPVGLLPAEAVDLDAGRQVWFPEHVHASLAFVPPDEIAQLVEESLALPGIDLQAPTGENELVAVLILAPRDRFSTAPVPTAPAPITRSGTTATSLAELVRSGFSQGAAIVPPAARPAASSGLYWYVRCRIEYFVPDAAVVAGVGG